jgi:hypothetical protein
LVLFYTSPRQCGRFLDNRSRRCRLFLCMIRTVMVGAIESDAIATERKQVGALGFQLAFWTCAVFLGSPAWTIVPPNFGVRPFVTVDVVAIPQSRLQAFGAGLFAVHIYLPTN